MWEIVQYLSYCSIILIRAWFIVIIIIITTTTTTTTTTTIIIIIIKHYLLHNIINMETHCDKLYHR
jgi:hypothetical protein